jgi:DnaK suppressor protein
MATKKQKPAPAAKKKAAASKAGAKKPAAKNAAASKKPAPRKPAKPVKPAKAAKSVKSAKPAPKKKAAPVKSAKPVAKVAAATKKPAPAKVNVKAQPAKKPAVQVESKKPTSQSSKAVPAQSVPTKSSGTTKGKMSAAATSISDVSREDGRYALPSTVVIELPNNYKPSAKEEYMGPRHLAYFRAKLQKWREDLVEESKQTIDNLRDEVRDVGDEAERATRETENSLELRTRDRYRKLIGKIDKALKRIEEGRYGFCEETDEEIGLERLEARPIATLSLDAQERWEHRQKQMGD